MRISDWSSDVCSSDLLNRVRLNPGVDLEAWRAALHAAFPDEGWTVRDRTNASPRVQRFVDRTALFLTLVGLSALLVGGVGVGNAVRSYLDGKTATIATLKCLCAPGRLVFRLYLTQLLLLALGGVALGMLIGALAPEVGSASCREWGVSVRLEPGGGG